MNLDDILQISDACIRCGSCKEDCPARIIEVDKTTPPHLTGEHCIRCGHCEAVCPVDALTNTLLHHEEDLPLAGLAPFSAADAERFLRTRRSVRMFKDTPVDKKTTEALIRIGRYAPTARNSQGVSYLVVASPEVRAALRRQAVDYYAAHQEGQPAIAAALRAFEATDHDHLMRGAPMLILALCSHKLDCARANAQFALSYIELMAPSLGLGSCWAGYMERYFFADTADMRTLLQLPEGQGVYGALLFGYPATRHRKAPTRNGAQVHWR